MNEVTQTPTPSENALLEVSHLVGGYDGTAVIKDCNMAVQPGEIVVIMGGVRFREIYFFKTFNWS